MSKHTDSPEYEAERQALGCAGGQENDAEGIAELGLVLAWLVSAVTVALIVGGLIYVVARLVG